MTKERYFEMCEALGSEPLESEIPIEIDDFPEEVQQAFQIYYLLKDIWDTMGGNYLGKDTTTLFNFFDLYDIDKPNRLIIVSLIQQMDYARSRLISQKQKAKEPSSKKA